MPSAAVTRRFDLNDALLHWSRRLRIRCENQPMASWHDCLLVEPVVSVEPR